MRARTRRRPHGLSYVEALVALAILALALVPAMQSLGNGVGAVRASNETSEAWLAAQGKLEAVLARPYGELVFVAWAANGFDKPSSYSDASGTPARRIVYLSNYDGDSASFTNADTGLMWVKVTVDGTPAVFETLTAR